MHDLRWHPTGPDLIHRRHDGVRRFGRWLGTALLGLTTTAAAQVPTVSPGFPNVVQTPGELLSGLNAPEQGRTAIIAYHNGLLFTVPEVPSSQPGADFLVRIWDISDPRLPAIVDTLEVTPMPVNAHGYLKSGEYLVLGPNWPPGGEWSFQFTAGPQRVLRGPWPDLAYIGVRGTLFQPWIVHQTYWSYGTVEGNATIELNGSQLADWDHLGTTGVIGHPFLIGDLLIFASDQSRTGVATYDLRDPTSPVLLDVLTTGGPGGYWPEVWGGDGRLYVAFPYRTQGNGMRVVDVTDPRDLRLVADVPLGGAEAMYLQFQDEYGFTGDHKVDMRTFASVLDLDGANVVRTNPPGTGVDASQFALPLGNLLVTGGIGPNEGMAIWAHQAAPDNRGPSVGYHIPQDGRTNYPVTAPISVLIHEELESFTIVNGVSFIVRPVGGGFLPGRLTLAFDDVLTFTPSAPLLPDTTYELVIPAGLIKDAAGNGIVGHSSTFSTGSTVSGNRPPVVDSFVFAPYPATPLLATQFTATVRDPDGDPTEVRFDFGDGSPKSPWASTPLIDHPYAAVGHYRATVQVRDDRGGLVSANITVTVTDPTPSPAPTQSAPVVCNNGTFVYTVNPDNDTFTVIDSRTLEVLVEAPTCADPRSIASGPGNGLWVACHDADEVRLHSRLGTTLARFDVGYGAAPSGIALSPDGRTAYVTLEGRGALARFDTAARAETGRLSLGPSPRAVAVSGDSGRVFVTRLVSPADHGEVWEIDAASFSVARTLRLPKLGDRANDDTTASGRGVPNLLAGVTLSPLGDRAWIAGNKPNAERGLLFFNDLDQDNTVRNLTVGLDLTTGLVTQAIDLDNSDSASAVAYSPLGDYLFVALQGNAELLVLDALRIDRATGLGAIVTRVGTGLAPQGICTDVATGRTFVKNFMDRSLTVLETDPLFRTGAINLASSTVATVATEALSPDVLRGKQIFYHASDPRMSSEGYLSCATCHLDGGHDGRTWDFTGRGEGLRNTTSLRGRAGTDHGNVHWSANFDEIQDFEGDIRNAFGGSGFLSATDWAATMNPLGPPKAGLDTDLDALAAYVGSLDRGTVPRSPYRQLDGAYTPAANTGAAVFLAEGCDVCHAGSRLTDSTLGAATLHDVGTLRTTSGGRLGGPLLGVDTPTLQGVWNTAPYLHDGAAATLGEVFSNAGGAVLAAEDGVVSGGAQVVDMWVELNNDDTVHGRALVALNSGRLTFSNVDGGSGGAGDLELRYSIGWPSTLDVVVNGMPRTLNVPLVGNDPAWRSTIWRRLRVPDVTLSAGPTNTIELANGNLEIDDLTVTTADERALAQPHRRVLARPQIDRDNLVAFLRELDGHGEPETGARCGDAVDNDGDGDIDCDDSDCIGSPSCPGLAINRTIALTPVPSPAVASLFDIGCAAVNYRLCQEAWLHTPTAPVTLVGEAAPAGPGLWLYEQAPGAATLRMARNGNDIIASW